MITDAKARAAKPKDKDYKLGAGEGLYLQVRTNGGKYWKLKFRFGGKERKLSFGVYPAVSLREAREKATEAKTLLRQGINPSEQKRLNKAAKLLAEASSLSAISAEWMATHIEDKSASHQKRTKATLARHLLPYLGDRPLAEITAVELLAVLRRAESAGLIDSAHRILEFLAEGPQTSSELHEKMNNELSDTISVSNLGNQLKLLVEKELVIKEIRRGGRYSLAKEKRYS